MPRLRAEPGDPTGQMDLPPDRAVVDLSRTASASSAMVRASSYWMIAASCQASPERTWARAAAGAPSGSTRTASWYAAREPWPSPMDQLWS